VQKTCSQVFVKPADSRAGRRHGLPLLPSRVLSFSPVLLITRNGTPVPLCADRSPFTLWKRFSGDSRLARSGATCPAQLKSKQVVARASLQRDGDMKEQENLMRTSEGTVEIKRKRGRPLGSKSKSPRSKQRKAAAAGQNRDDSTSSESRSGTSSSSFVNMQDVLSLPNGLTGKGHPPNFLDELLPRIAKRDAKESVSGLANIDEENRQRAILQIVRNMHLSNFRRSESFKHLKPFQLKADTLQKCPTCDGTGMMQCDCCKGAGIMDEAITGPPGTLYKYEGGEAIVPEFSGLIGEVVCPFCGGMTLERCLKCLGSGEIHVEGMENQPAGAAQHPGTDVAHEWASREDFLQKYADRIEIGVDGTTILRKKKRVRRKKVDIPNSTGDADANGSTVGEVKSPAGAPASGRIETVGPYCELPRRRRRGRPRKGETMDDLFPLRDIGTPVQHGPTSGPLKGNSIETVADARETRGRYGASSTEAASKARYPKVKYDKVVASMKSRRYSDILNKLVAKEGAPPRRIEGDSLNNEGPGLPIRGE
jgi:hypothetical protein